MLPPTLPQLAWRARGASAEGAEPLILGIPKRTVIVVAVIAGVLLIYAYGSNERSSEGSPGSSGTGCQVSVTVDILNVREAPSRNAEIVGKLKQDAKLNAQPETQGGFRKLSEGKWASADFLTPREQAGCS